LEVIMAGQSIRLLDAIVLSANKEQPRDQVVDVGAYRQLVIQGRVLKAGTGVGGGKLKIQHSAVNEAGTFEDLSSASWVVDSTAASAVVSSDTFLRYIRWVCDASVAGTPVMIVDVIAKE
jgi:hypothetical protein